MIQYETSIGPERPAIIAHRYECPSCGAVGGEPCRLSPRFTQEYSHVARHRAAQRADWRQLMREVESGRGPISSLSFARVSA